MIQYISYMNIFCDKKFKSLFISLLNKENIINGRQTENRMRACVRAFVCVCVYCIQVLFRLSQTTFFFFYTKFDFFVSNSFSNIQTAKFSSTRTMTRNLVIYIYFHLTVEILMLQNFFPIRTSLCPSERFLNVKKLWTTKIGNNDDLIECLSYNRFSRW